jgi:hypothetical protein
LEVADQVGHEARGERRGEPTVHLGVTSDPAPAKRQL